MSHKLRNTEKQAMTMKCNNDIFSSSSGTTDKGGHLTENTEKKGPAHYRGPIMTK